MAKTLPEIVLIGSISIDRIMNFGGRYKELIEPDKIHVLSLSILIDNLAHSRGGTAANIAYNLSLLGESPSLLTSIGQDGTDYLAHLTSLGIDTSRVHLSDLPTSTFTVLTDRDDNQVGGFYPGAMSDSASLKLSPWQDKDPLVVISAYDPSTMDRLVKESRDLKMRLIYDIGQQVSNVDKSDLEAGVQAASIIIVNDYELGVLAKRTVRSEAELKKSIPLLITTLGSEGALITGKEVAKPITVKAVPQVQVVDPTGAGDAFRAGFLYGLRRNWSTEHSVKLGNVIASFALEKHGTQEHRFSLADVKDRYYSTYGELVKL